MSRTDTNDRLDEEARDASSSHGQGASSRFGGGGRLTLGLGYVGLMATVILSLYAPLPVRTQAQRLTGYGVTTPARSGRPIAAPTRVATACLGNGPGPREAAG